MLCKIYGGEIRVTYNFVACTSHGDGLARGHGSCKEGWEYGIMGVLRMAVMVAIPA